MIIQGKPSYPHTAYYLITAMPEYVSIRDDVVKKLEEHLPEIRERFGIETLGLFGSVSRGEDTAESDIDILYRFKPGIKTYHAMLDLAVIGSAAQNGDNDAGHNGGNQTGGGGGAGADAESQCQCLLIYRKK